MPGRTSLKIARSAAEEYIRHQAYLSLPPALPPALLRQQACYVTIFENPGHHVRAQFGHPLPRYSVLAQEIIMNTIEAIRSTPARPFRPIDITYLSYAVLILDSLERISRPEHLHPERYGLYLRSDRNKSAIVLPGRFGMETPDDQIATAFRESGIRAQEEAVTMYRFSVTSYEDE